MARNSPAAQRRLVTDVDSVLTGPVQRQTLNWSSVITRHLQRRRRPQSAAQATAVPVITPPLIPVAHHRVSTASDVMISITADRAAAGMPTDPGLIAERERVSQEQRLIMQRPDLTGKPPAAIREDPALTVQPPPMTITEELEPDHHADPRPVSIVHNRSSGNMHCLQQVWSFTVWLSHLIRLDIVACASLTAMQECICSLLRLSSLQKPATQRPNSVQALLYTWMLEYHHQHEHSKLPHFLCEHASHTRCINLLCKAVI